MSRKADCWDNAVVESFFARLKTELLNRRSWRTARELKDAVARYIEGWYNPRRLHSSLGYLAPNQFEQRYFWNQAQAA
jgi:transposase InsO family protein